MKVVYTGRRLVDGKKVWQRFEDEKGHERFFAGIRRVYIGHAYEAAAKSMSARPKQLDDPRVDNPTWEALDALVDDHREKQRAAKRWDKASRPIVKAAVKALVPLVRGISFFEVESLVRHLALKARRASK